MAIRYDWYSPKVVSEVKTLKAVVDHRLTSDKTIARMIGSLQKRSVTLFPSVVSNAFLPNATNWDTTVLIDMSKPLIHALVIYTAALRYEPESG